MEKKYITDTDFLPQELTHYHGLYRSELTDDLYQIVYGIFQPSHSLGDVYELVVRTAYRQKSAAIRKFKLLSWKKSLETILKAMNKLESKDYEVIVFIPLRACEVSLSAAESYFQLAIFTISELLDGDSVPTPAYPDAPLVPNIKKLFEESYAELFLALDEGKPDNEDYYKQAKYCQAIVLDEMYRRGIDSIKLKQDTEPTNPVKWLSDVAANKEVKNTERPILPSEYYGDTTLYKQTFIENGSQQVLDSGSDVVSSSDAPESQTVYDNDTIGTRAAVMYYMLSSFCPITDDNFNRAVAMIDFAVGKQSPKFNVNKANDTEINKVNNKNSIKKYVRNCRDNRKYLEEPGSQKVRERLTSQGFDIPTPKDSSTKLKPF